MSAPPSYWLSHPSSRLHRMEEGHPECPERLAAIEDRLLAGGLDFFLRRLDAPEAPVEALLRVHEADHVESVLRTRPAEGLVHVDPDTAMNAHTADAALHAAGAGVLAVELVLSCRAGFVFCGVRPPGHHAERHRAMGFCFFNNIAVAAAEALARGIGRVAVLDFDVHYGNGTADIFRAEPRVLLCSTYQHPLYPDWAGDPDAPGLVDVPLAQGDGSVAYRAAISEHWLPALQEFAPELLLVSAGFDAHIRDPLGGLRLSDEDFYWTGQQIRDFAAEHCEHRVIAMLEGGYEPHALARCVEAFVRPFVDA
ncbi:histone deacetylase family protein [Solimonas terrae]|uniref:Histone deacetylase family protein n=1 Tax=Solimonas terrae TaxID=1396819 RepID=A0A6M2BMB5_9GAMM|nr:histone deacetylase family protein [Solimonas terrae]NGY03239.1 histone deacetylase family protein [Solimonas terrae]